MIRRLLLAVLLLAAVTPLRAREIDSSGKYAGFFQSTAHVGQWGAMEFVIDEVRNHRFGGMVVMIVGPTQVRVPFPVNGTVSESGEFTGSGKGVGGMVQFHGQIDFFQGGCAIADAKYKLIGPGTTQDDGTATLLRQFLIAPSDSQPPNVNGIWTGIATSSLDGSRSPFTLDVKQACAFSNNQRGFSSAFFGTEVIDPNTEHALTFYFQGSISGDGRFAVIGWDLSNDRFIVIGSYNPPPDPEKPATATADYRLMFGSGFTDRGTFGMGQELSPRDPCSQGEPK